jgi:endoglucanase
MSSASIAPAPPAGWYANPEGRGQRYWDGEYWADQYLPAKAAARRPVARISMRRLALALLMAGACLTAGGLMPGVAAARRVGQDGRSTEASPPVLTTNRLGLADPVPGNPLAGAQLYVNPDSPAAQAEQPLLQIDPTDAALLAKIALEPGANRFYMWNMMPDAEQRVASYMQQSQSEEPGSTVMVSTYSLAHSPCGSTANATVEGEYENFINQVAEGIGNTRVIFFLEIDSLIGTSCLTASELAIREAELSYAVQRLEADPHVLVYLDAGAGDAQPITLEAQLLRASDVADAQGFFVNATHYDWTNDELAYGEDLSELLGGAHFIINTSDNGQGPLKPPHPVTEGTEVLCNPINAGLGPLSVSPGGFATQTGYQNLDGLLWFDNPGGSGGNGPGCDTSQSLPDAPGNAVFWPAYAEMLARNQSSNFGPPVPWQPHFVADPQHVRFTSKPVGATISRASTSQTITVTYLAGNGSWTLGKASFTGPDAEDFAVTTNGCLNDRLERNWTCHVSVRFKPHRKGRANATLEIAVNAPATAIDIPISGSTARRTG